MVIPLAIFFELLWLDAFYIGAFIPPSGTTCLLLVLTVHSLVNGPAEQYLLTTTALAIPCSLSMMWVEQRIRQYNNHWHTSFLGFVSKESLPKSNNAHERGGSFPSFSRYLLYQTVITTGANLCLFWTMLIFVGVSAQVLKNTLQTFPLLETFIIGFSNDKIVTILLLGGFLGGCLSLRFKKAQAFFFLLSLVLVSFMTMLVM